MRGGKGRGLLPHRGDEDPFRGKSACDIHTSVNKRRQLRSGDFPRLENGSVDPSLLGRQRRVRRSTAGPVDRLGPRGRRCFPPRKSAGEGCPQHLAHGSKALARSGGQEREVGGGDVRIIVQKRENLAGLASSQGCAVRKRRDQPGDLSAPERDQHADPDPGARLLFRRNAIGERMIDRKRHRHFHEHRGCDRRIHHHQDSTVCGRREGMRRSV
jgi:hypothetical protein